MQLALDENGKVKDQDCGETRCFQKWHFGNLGRSCIQSSQSGEGRPVDGLQSKTVWYYLCIMLILYCITVDICCVLVLTEDQHHTLKSLVGPVEEFLTVSTYVAITSMMLFVGVCAHWFLATCTCGSFFQCIIFSHITITGTGTVPAPEHFSFQSRTMRSIFARYIAYNIFQSINIVFLVTDPGPEHFRPDHMNTNNFMFGCNGEGVRFALERTWIWLPVGYFCVMSIRQVLCIFMPISWCSII